MGDTLQHLEDQRRYHERLIEVSPTSVVTADADFTVTSWNPAAEMVSELPEPEQLVAIEAMCRVRSPDTSEALEAIA